MYTTYVHGLKSAAAIIGADELSEAAKALEMAGHNGDTAFIDTHNAGFIQALEALLGSINGMISEAKRDFSLETDTEALKSKLAELKSALETLNAGVMYQSIESLLKLTKGSDINATVRKISDRVLMSEYDKALALIEALAEIK